MFSGDFLLQTTLSISSTVERRDILGGVELLEKSNVSGKDSGESKTTLTATLPSGEFRVPIAPAPRNPHSQGSNFNINAQISVSILCSQILFSSNSVFSFLSPCLIYLALTDLCALIKKL